jgi:hypothetical protein
MLPLLLLPSLAYADQDGQALKSMCHGAEKVRALAVMCHSYTNGYIDAVNYASITKGGKARICVHPGQKDRIPNLLSEWLLSHPEALKQPAAKTLDKVLNDHFACR